MQPERPTNIDSPTTNDRLGFKAYANGISAAIVDATVRNQLPMTVGIYGRWGSGKTSLMKMVEAALVPNGAERPKTEGDREAVHKRERGLKWWLGIVGVMVVVGFLATPFAAHKIAGIYPKFAPTAQFAAFFCVFAGFGACARAGFETWWRGSVLETLDDGGAAWIAARPVLASLGAALAMIGLYDVTLFKEVTLRSVWVLTTSYVGVFVLSAFAEEFYQLPISAFKRLRRKKEEANEEAAATDPEFQVIWFNAWKYTEEKELWATLLQRLLNELKVNAAGKKRLLIKWQLWKRSIEWKSGALEIAKKLAPTLGKGLVAALAGVATAWLANLALANAGGGALSGKAAGPAAGVVSGLATLGGLLRRSVLTPLADVDFEKYRKKESFRDRVAFFTEFSEELKEVTEISRGAGNPVVVMLDDLDRCLPERAVSVLEAIKLFVGESAQVVFLIGADREFVERAVDVMYAKLKEGADITAAMRERFNQLGHEYLEKIVQLPFNLPPIDVPQIDTFIDSTFPNDTVVLNQKHIFAAGLLANPRQVVRAVGTYRFIVSLAEQKNLRYTKVIDDGVLAKVVVVQYRWPELYAEVVEHPELLSALETAFKTNAVDLPDYEATWKRIQESTGKRALQAMLTLLPTLSGVNLAPYLFFTSRSQTTPAAAPTAQANAPAAPAPPPAAIPVAQAAAAAATGSGAGVAVVMPPPQMPSAAPAGAATSAPATPPLIVTPASASNAAIQTLSAEILKKNLDVLNARIDELKLRGADSAVVSQLLGNQSRITSYLASNLIVDATELWHETRILTDSAFERLNEAANVAQAFQEVQLGSDGSLMTHRAVSYNNLELVLTETPTGTRYVLADRAREVVSGALPPMPPSLSTQIVSFENNAIGLDIDQLGREVRDWFGPLLTSAVDARNSNRIRVQTMPGPLASVPWEAMNLGGTDPIGLDPKHCLVRGVSEQTGPSQRTNFPIKVLLAGFSGSQVIAPQKVQEILGGLNAAFQPLVGRQIVQTRVVENPNFDEFRGALREERTHILHIVAGDGFNGMQAGPTQWPAGMGWTQDAVNARFGEMLKDAGVLALILEIPMSKTTARDWAPFVPMTIGLQNSLPPADAAFGLAFYRALLRTGQADFALTEGRRAVYTAALKFFKENPPIAPMDATQQAKLAALAYCSFQSIGAGTLFEGAGTAGPRKFNL